MHAPGFVANYVKLLKNYITKERLLLPQWSSLLIIHIKYNSFHGNVDNYRNLLRQLTEKDVLNITIGFICT